MCATETEERIKRKKRIRKRANRLERIRDAQQLSEKKIWLLGYMIPIDRKGARARTHTLSLCTVDM